MTPTALVLSSGGTRGVAHIGALQAFERAGWLSPVPGTLIGTSAGAIVCCLLALGYTPGEMARLAHSLDLTDLVGRRMLNLSTILTTLPTSFGVIDSSSSEVRFALDTLIARSRVARGSATLTFGELKRRTGRRLLICSTDLETSDPVYFGPERSPNRSIASALRASAAVPLIFTPCEGRYVDGALTDHYPFRASREPPGRTIGVVIVDARPSGGGAAAVAPPLHPPGTRAAGNFVDYARSLVRAVETSRTRALLRQDEDVRARTVVVRCPRAPLSPGQSGGARRAGAEGTPDAAVVIEEPARCLELERRGYAAAAAFVARLRKPGVLSWLSPSAIRNISNTVVARRLVGRPHARPPSRPRREGAKKGEQKKIRRVGRRG